MHNYLIGLLCLIVICVIFSLLVPIVILLVCGCVTACDCLDVEINTAHDNGIAELNNDRDSRSTSMIGIRGPIQGPLQGPFKASINDNIVGEREMKSLKK